MKRTAVANARCASARRMILVVSVSRDCLRRRRTKIARPRPDVTVATIMLSKIGKPSGVKKS
jgi:hypothetical protein